MEMDLYTKRNRELKFHTLENRR